MECERKGSDCVMPEFQTILYQGKPKSRSKVEEGSIGKTNSKMEGLLLVVGLRIELELNQTKQSKIDGDTHGIGRGKKADLFIIKYLTLSAKSAAPTIRTTGLVGIYENRISISSHGLGDVLEESVVEVPVINRETIFDSATKSWFGFADVHQYWLVQEYQDKVVDPEPSVRLVIRYNKELATTATPSSATIPVPINESALKNQIYLELPSLVAGAVSAKAIEGIFMNLASYLVPHIDKALNKFCSEFPRRWSHLAYGFNRYTDEGITSWTEYEKSILDIFLSLAFSNVVVLKAVILWSTNETSFKFWKKLRHEIFLDLNHRTQYITGACCDHTVATVLLLLDAELSRTVVEPDVWQVLNRILLQTVLLRGGPERLAASTSGRFFATSITSWYCTKCLFVSPDVMLPYDPTDLYAYSTPLWQIVSQISSIYSKTFHLHRLINLARHASDLNNEAALVRYDSLNDANILDILSEADSLMSNIEYIRVPYVPQQIPEHLLSLVALFKNAAILLVYQLVYNHTSTCARTLLQVKRTLSSLKKVISQLLNDEIPFITPLFPITVIAIDIHDQYHRDWLLDQLVKLKEKSGYCKWETVIRLLKMVWNINATGNTWVSWTDLVTEHGLMIPI